MAEREREFEDRREEQPPAEIFAVEVAPGGPFRAGDSFSVTVRGTPDGTCRWRLERPQRER